MNDARTTLVLHPAGAASAGRELAEGLEGARIRALEPAGETRAQRIAAALTDAERAIEEEEPGAVVLCGDGPEMGAAALVAVKLGVPVARVAGDEGGDAALADLGGPISAGLVDLTVSAGHGEERVAGEIRAWLATYTSSS
jgi:UDP-N-acetylglucosamine 2-epimerase